MVDITILGTAALMPLPERFLASEMLSCCGHSILFDCGEGTQTAARKAGVSLSKTDIIALTHYHGDHIFGLPGLLQSMFVSGRTQPLYITGPEGIQEHLSPIFALAGPMPFDIFLFEIPEEGFRISEIISGWPGRAVLSAFKTVHRVPSLGYSFTLGRAGKFNPQAAEKLDVPKEQWKLLQKGQSIIVNGKTVLPEQVAGEERKGIKIIVTGDTAANDNLSAAAENADLIISEGTYAEDEHEKIAVERGHMTFRHAAETAKNAKAKKLVLTHFSQVIPNPAQSVHIAEAVFENTVCAEDGMKITLNFEE